MEKLSYETPAKYMITTPLAGKWHTFMGNFLGIIFYNIITFSAAHNSVACTHKVSSEFTAHK
jgi:hypothetical protein